MLVAIFWMYTGFGIRLCASVMLPKFSAAKILPNPKLKKIKEIFIFIFIFLPNFRYKLWDLGLLRVSVALSLPIP